MTKLTSQSFKRVLIALLPALSVFAWAGDAEQTLARDFPPQSISTVARANAALALVPAARAEINERTQRETANCYESFLTSSCLSDVRSRDRKASKVVRQVEVEANALLRKERAAERDRAVAEREKRAAEQRANAISITGAARDAETPEDAPGTDDARR